jgi:hypothetical protein
VKDTAVGAQPPCKGAYGRKTHESLSYPKYNHLVANLLSFHTLVSMTRALHRIQKDGHVIDMEALATLSPYRTEHINRFGNYTVNPNRLPEPLEPYLAFQLSTRPG